MEHTSVSHFLGSDEVQQSGICIDDWEHWLSWDSLRLQQQQLEVPGLFPTPYENEASFFGDDISRGGSDAQIEPQIWGEMLALSGASDIDTRDFIKDYSPGHGMLHCAIKDRLATQSTTQYSYPSKTCLISPSASLVDANDDIPASLDTRSTRSSPSPLRLVDETSTDLEGSLSPPKRKHRSKREILERSRKAKRERYDHQAIEKRYRDNLNTRLAELKECVPTVRAKFREHIDDVDETIDGLVPARNLKKGTVIAKAIEYIQHLERQKAVLTLQVAQLRRDAGQKGIAS